MQKFNKRLMSILGLLVLGSVNTLISCDKGDISEAQYQIEYQRNAQLVNTFNNEILPLNLDFIASAETLNEAVSVFSLEPSLINLENLDSVAIFINEIKNQKWIDPRFR